MLNNSIVLSDLNAYRNNLSLQYIINDRVVNLKFVRKSGKSFVVRSDYEPVYVGNRKFTFTKCLQKPEIKVRYRKATQATAIKIEIDVTNLHIQSASDVSVPYEAAANFSNNADPIKTVVVQLGYFNMFPRFDDPTQLLTVEHFNNLKSNKLLNDYEEIECQVLAVYPVKMPPDGVTRFLCVVGQSDDVYSTKLDDADSTTVFKASFGAEKYFFEYITRRYARRVLSPSERVLDPLGSGIIAPPGTQLRLSYPGRLTVPTANSAGVRVYVTDNLKASMFKGATEVSAPTIHRELSATLMEIQNEICPDARFYFLVTGNIVAFSFSQDTPKSVNASLKKARTLPGEFVEEQELPAIYSITYSGLRSIKAPFFPFVRPFQIIDFSSKYNLGSLISYYYAPEKGKEKFFILNYTVDFSTVGDENEMELLSTDYEEE